MTKQISEQTILITGATDGLGKETARKLAALGARLILHGRNKAKLQSVVSALTAEVPSARVDTILADFSSLTQVRAMAPEIPAADIEAANRGLRALAAQEYFVRAPK